MFPWQGEPEEEHLVSYQSCLKPQPLPGFELKLSQFRRGAPRWSAARMVPPSLQASSAPAACLNGARKEAGDVRVGAEFHNGGFA